MENVESTVASVATALWGWPMIILLVGTHIYLTIRLKFPQRYIFKAIKLSVTKDSDSKGDVSQFGALATALAATIGTGNIIGIATAVALGGPGAVFWCWIVGFFGIATKYAEGLLAVKYRVKAADGTMSGGPMYALEHGVKSKALAIIFCIFTAIASLGIGNTVQSNSISMMLNVAYDIPTYLTGAILAILVTLVIVFGVKAIARICTFLVPFMAIFYVLGCLIILFINRGFLGETVELIINSAFSPQAAGGGFIGSTIMMAARFGIARGLFSNESGMGSAPIVAAAAKTRNSVRQALVSSTGTFWDTIVVCALTGLVIVSSIIAYPDISSTDGAALTERAFSKIPIFGPIILTVGLITFAFSTILGWTYYAEKSVEYLGGLKWVKIYRVFWILAVFGGAVINLSLVWNIADSMNALMAIPNLISLILLSGVLVSETKKYLWSGNIDETDENLQ